MPLSEEEQKLLAQLEESLAAEDPKLAHALRGTTPRVLQRRKVVLAVIGLVIGVALLVIGMQTYPAISVAGFLFMLVAAMIGVGAWQQVEATGPKKKPSPRVSSDGQFMDKLEERWRRRQKGDS